MNDIQLYTNEAAALAIKKDRGNYIINTAGGTAHKLVRDVDFGTIRKKNGDATTKTPTLFKSGAEKVAVAYGLCQRYTTETAIEDYENGFFYFRVRCDLVKIVNGVEYIITSSGGSANTREGRTGSQSCYDGANSALKMAQKRALVSAALSLGCISDMFTQDIESDTSDASVYYPPKDPNAKVTQAQITFFYSVAARHGLSKTDAKKFLAEHGYNSAKEIVSGKFDDLINDLDKLDDIEVEAEA